MNYINLFFLYFAIFFFTIFISKKLKFFDVPNVRKIHKSNTFNSGGVIIYLFCLFTINFYEFNYSIELIISIGFFIFLLGFIDDRINLKPSTKLIFLLLPSLYLILNGISINDLGNYEFIGTLNLGKFRIPFLLLSLGLLINATNYIDGIDGLLLTFFICYLSYYIFLIDDLNTVILLKIILIPSIFNLILNLLPASSNLKFFSGNAGSLFIGFFVGFLTIEIYNNFNIHPAYLIWPLWYPVYDFIHVNINRILNNKSIFIADNSHLHHKIFYKFKKNHYKTLLIFFITNICFIYFGFLLSNYSKFISLLLFSLGCLTYTLIRLRYK